MKAPMQTVPTTIQGYEALSSKNRAGAGSKKLTLLFKVFPLGRPDARGKYQISDGQRAEYDTKRKSYRKW